MFMTSVKSLLTDRGVFIFAAPYIVNLLKQNEYDTIYHEHLSYLSLKHHVPFFASHRMENFKLEQSHIHAGSFRLLVASKQDLPTTKAVKRETEQELRLRLHSR